MRRNYLQNSTGWLFIILLVLILMISSTIYVSADAEVNSDQQIEAGEIAISKTAVPVSLDQDNREYTITLSAAGSKVISQEPLDVVLVLDTSESMGSQIGDTSETRLDAVKIAAKAFANSVLTDNSNSSVTVVKYAGDKKGRTYEDDKWISFDNPFNDASTVLSFSNDLDEINSCLDDFVAENGTNIEAGLYQARQELDGRDSDVQKVVVLISDGKPTLVYSTAYVSVGSIWREDLLFYETVYEESYGITVGEGDNYDSEYRDKAIDEARLIRDRFDAKIFTVGISAPDSYDEVMYDVLNPSGDDRYHERYFEVTDTDSLNSAFASISGYINTAAENAVIVDVIGSDFELVESTAPGAEIAGETLMWDLGVIGGEVTDVRNVSFRVRAKDHVSGELITNEAAYLYFDTSAANVFYDDSQYDNPDSEMAREKRLTYERPVVIVPRIDDVYEGEDGNEEDETLHEPTELIVEEIEDIINFGETDSSDVSVDESSEPLSQPTPVPTVDFSIDIEEDELPKTGEKTLYWLVWILLIIAGGTIVRAEINDCDSL